MARTSEITHKIMSSIKSKDTRPEKALRKELWKRGLRYRKNVSTLPGKPDLVFIKAKIAIFCTVIIGLLEDMDRLRKN